ncbi:hypothetical protein OIU83_13555 [Flavobacterium sp. LS1R49]|uniref:Uncharacterized protein n=1 Tax=Flavobacterium shii TaxID=2987687 RepID=A0A9X3BYD2_9FLAO|nr:hypothetical protein [Flavobacterium shii]MCV9928690.1 hypothetical protein [Flavobacterium shii]
MKSKKKQKIIKIFINSTKIPNFELDNKSNTFRISNIGKLNDIKLDQIKTEIVYERDSGKDKVIHSQYFVDRILEFDDERLNKRYNMVFACDTNTKFIGDKKVCVGCLSILGTSNSGVSIIPIRAIAFSINDLNNINPERVSWKYFLKYVNNDKYKESKICFFVDSELGKLDQINRALESVFDDYFLPQNIDLSYASSDSGREYVGNKLLSCSDNAAKELLNFLIENSYEFPSFQNATLFSKNI